MTNQPTNRMNVDFSLLHEYERKSSFVINILLCFAAVNNQESLYDDLHLEHLKIKPKTTSFFRVLIALWEGQAKKLCVGVDHAVDGRMDRNTEEGKQCIVKGRHRVCKRIARGKKRYCWIDTHCLPIFNRSGNDTGELKGVKNQRRPRALSPRKSFSISSTNPRREISESPVENLIKSEIRAKSEEPLLLNYEMLLDFDFPSQKHQESSKMTETFSMHDMSDPFTDLFNYPIIGQFEPVVYHDSLGNVFGWAPKRNN
ncbi:hypothetical protein BDK51DRAFT_45131 [Blyttiomyces helicus]|uniref:Uncharacterized protein n=1 Tax=Blyttiomyces helicus TaxID=388810 RepID=A0A4P9WLU0_9FUNG|nr:hypothetical protein BDK51DRAFT_45131 [Blyttiomyces helicus]|eukprot:RKO94009.1 hypothetical protein BDK51DRAFT_45131 [Blyttiomyces helicus]